MKSPSVTNQNLIDKLGEVGTTEQTSRATGPQTWNEARAAVEALPRSKGRAAALRTIDLCEKSGLDLSALPPDVRQRILEARNESVNEFLKDWATSIAQQAQLDKAAHLRAQLQAQMLRRTIDHAHVKQPLRGELLQCIASLTSPKEPSPDPLPVKSLGKGSNFSPTCSEGLKEPGALGVSLNNRSYVPPVDH